MLESSNQSSISYFFFFQIHAIQLLSPLGAVVVDMIVVLEVCVVVDVDGWIGGCTHRIGNRVQILNEGLIQRCWPLCKSIEKNVYYCVLYKQLWHYLCLTSLLSDPLLHEWWRLYKNINNVFVLNINRKGFDKG